MQVIITAQRRCLLEMYEWLSDCGPWSIVPDYGSSDPEVIKKSNLDYLHQCAKRPNAPNNFKETTFTINMPDDQVMLFKLTFAINGTKINPIDKP